MRGNAAILKCSIPSFVADFVHVIAWVDEEGVEVVASDDFSASENAQRTLNDQLSFTHLLYHSKIIFKFSILFIFI